MGVLASTEYTLAEDPDTAWLAESDELTIVHAVNLATDALNTEDTQEPARTEKDANSGIIADFRISSGQIFTVENIAKMYQIEQEIVNMTVYQERLCYVDGLDFTQCAPDSVESLLGQFVTYTTQAQIDQALHDLSEDYWWHFAQDFPDTLQSNIYKSLIFTGYPYPNASNSAYSDYRNIEDDYDAQVEHYMDWNQDVYDTFQSDGALEVTPFSWALIGEWMTAEFNKMNMLLACSILAILVYLCFHTQSLFLGGVGMFQILLSFCPAYVIYRFLFGITYFGVMNMMIIFIILGIGADDMFVMTDAWVQSKFEYESGGLLRMNYTFKRASKAMMITSLTTAVAFYSTGISDIVPIRAFGIWAGTVILCNYMYFITLFPCLIMIQFYYPLTRCCGLDECCHACGGDKICSCCAPHHTEELEVKNNVSDDDLRCLEHCFKYRFHPCIEKAKYPVIVCFLALLAAGFWSATVLEAPQSSEDWINPNSELGEILNSGRDFYSNPDYELMQIQLYWGIEGVDSSGTDAWDPEDNGKVIWDDTFNILPGENQQFFLDTCNDLAARTDIVFGSDPVDCFMRDFKTYIESNGETFPKTYATQADFDADMIPFLTPVQQGGAGYSHYYTDNRVGYEVDQDDGSYTLRFISMSVTTKLNYDRDSPDEKTTIKDLMDEFVNEANANGPTGMNNCFQAAWEWAWLVTQSALLNGALQGIAIAIPLATLMLFIFTRNWIVTFFAVFTIVGVIMSLSLFVIVVGWEFGVVESINVILVVGFSIDYVVHLGHSYLEAGEAYEGRSERLQHSLLTMGISVSSGAFTTALSGVPLLFSLMMFLYKMGSLIIATVVFSILWSLFLFSSCMATFGPEKEQGQIPTILSLCKKDKVEDKPVQDKSTANLQLVEVGP